MTPDIPRHLQMNGAIDFGNITFRCVYAACYYCCWRRYLTAGLVLQVPVDDDNACPGSAAA